MFECLIRNHDVRIIPVNTIGDAIAKERAQERKRKRLDPLPEDNGTNETDKDEQGDRRIAASKTATETRGHTSYLTFGTFLPVLKE